MYNMYIMVKVASTSIMYAEKLHGSLQSSCNVSQQSTVRMRFWGCTGLHSVPKRPGQSRNLMLCPLPLTNVWFDLLFLSEIMQLLLRVFKDTDIGYFKPSHQYLAFVMPFVVSFPDPTLKEGKGPSAFWGAQDAAYHIVIGMTMHRFGMATLCSIRLSIGKCHMIITQMHGVNLIGVTMHIIKQLDVPCFSVSLQFVVPSPDPTLCEGKGLMTFERFLGSCKLSIFVFAQANQIAAL